MNLKSKNTIRTVFLFMAITLSSATFAQDRMAMVAPAAKSIRTIDSLSIIRMLDEENLSNPASSLYPNWSNKYTTNYGVALPKEFKIDLRSFHMPCKSRLVTSHYGYRASFRRNHYGTDIKVYVGDTIYAAFSGKVRIVAYNGNGYGKYIVIRHPNGLETVYGHLSKQLCTQDQTVKAGQPIGLGGNTGRSTGSHLHFETRFLGQFIDPEKLFDFVAQDVLSDFYVFRSNGKSYRVTANSEKNGGEGEELTEQQALAQAKQQESKEFQAERKQAVRSHIHRVARGENISSIARKRGISVSELCKMNNLSKNSVLRPGQILKYS